MEKIFKNYRLLIEQFNENKSIVEDYYYYVMTVCLFMNEKCLVINQEVYDYLFVELIKKLNGGSLGPLSDYADYYKKQRVHSINAEIIKVLNVAKDDIVNPTPLGKAILEFDKERNINRRGWIIRSVPECYYESNALHTMQMVFLISMLCASKLISVDDPKKIYEMILIHEIGENIAGDIVEIDPKHKDKNILEEVGVLRTFNGIDRGDYFIRLWREFEDKKTKIARLAYEIDKLDAVLKAEFLSDILNREDLLNDFYDYEDKRNTFVNSELKPLFEIVRSLSNK